ncbi:hypothetical protein Q4F19_16795 [Sphingomonas sp. BIUV-7]|uniref:Uncharacterized protein n=1 Tax=Sphingomonas natans TaxID=3063330 RepID=A0ABT8YCJ0_9SPHN|nr:hypothetical protein [Sphingomonas sp. BIUV-7]MDO6416050.1 hypothetical protein [Sphingomonas sp. BIUV-7]
MDGAFPQARRRQKSLDQEAKDDVAATNARRKAVPDESVTGAGEKSILKGKPVALLV